MLKPRHVTFTGVDDWCDVKALQALSARYPIEWGILFSPDRQGVDPRYPGGDAQSRLAWSGLQLSAHLCGDYSRAIMEARRISPPVDLGIFDRIQINCVAPNLEAVGRFRRGWGPRCILQTRSDLFPQDSYVDWLFDPSGGRGERPAAWPRHPGGHRLVGYAGGITPDNVADVIAAIDAVGPFWLDMESGIRTDNRLDLSKCEAVCRAIWGEMP